MNTEIESNGVVKKKNPKTGSEGKDDFGIVPMNIVKMTVKVRGISPLIVHAFSEKAKKQIRDKQMKKAKSAKEAKDPEADFEAAKYTNAEGKDCIPAICLKAAIVNAARFADDLKMTVLRGAIFIEGELLPITYGSCTMREDTVRVGMGTTDLRYRPEYKDWSVDVDVRFNSRVLSKEQVVNLISLAGFSVGICEWRPERNGQYGRFEVQEVTAFG